MNIPVINPASATVQIRFPHVALTKNLMTSVYAAIVKEHEVYTTCTLLQPGGAKISREDGGYILIESERIVIHELVHEIGDVAPEPFPVAKERVAGFFKILFAHLSLQKFATSIKLIAHVDTDQPDGSVKFINAALGANFAPEKLEYHLGQKVSGIGLRISSKKEQPAPAFYDLRVEPLFRDTNKLYIDLDVQFDGSNTELPALEAQIDGVAAHLKGNIKELLSAL